MSVWLVWLIVYAAIIVAACTLAGTNRRTATHPPCPDCGTPLNPTQGEVMSNTEETYWAEHYTHTVPALAGVTGQDAQAVSYALAYIAGDYASMDDDEVIGTYLNEMAPEVAL